MESAVISFDSLNPTYFPCEDVDVILNVSNSSLLDEERLASALICLIRVGGCVTEPISSVRFPAIGFSKDISPWSCALSFKTPSTKNAEEKDIYNFQLLHEGKCLAVSSSFTVHWRKDEESFTNIPCSEAMTSSESCNFVLVDRESSEMSIIKADRVSDHSTHSVDGFTIAKSSISDPELPKHGKDTLSIEITRRVLAEQAVEELSRRVSQQLLMMNESQEDLAKFRIGYEREKAIKESLKDEIQTSRQTRNNEMDKLKALALSYKSECENLQDKLEDGKDLIDRFKVQIMEDRAAYEEELSKLKKALESSVSRYEEAVEDFETTLTSEKKKTAEFESEVEKYMQLTEKIRTETTVQLEDMKAENTRLQTLISEDRANHEQAMMEQGRTYQVKTSKLFYVFKSLRNVTKCYPVRRKRETCIGTEFLQ